MRWMLGVFLTTAACSNEVVGVTSTRLDRAAIGWYSTYTGSSYNSAGGVNTWTPLGSEGYVTFPGMAATSADAHAQILGAEEVCTLGSWAPTGSSETVKVRCTNFSLLYIVAGGGVGGSYAFASQPTTASYTPDDTWSTWSGSFNVLRSSTGTYTVKMPDQDTNLGHVVVSAVNESGAYFCNAGNWFANSGYVQIPVSCFTLNALGAWPADTAFTVLFLTQPSTFVPNTAWARVNWDGTSYSIPPAYEQGVIDIVPYQYNAFNAADLPDRGVFFATPVGSSYQCFESDFDIRPPSPSAALKCFASTGALEYPTAYDVLYLQHE